MVFADSIKLKSYPSSSYDSTSKLMSDDSSSYSSCSCCSSKQFKDVVSADSIRLKSYPSAESQAEIKRENFFGL